MIKSVRRIIQNIYNIDHHNVENEITLEILSIPQVMEYNDILNDIRYSIRCDLKSYDADGVASDFDLY